MKKYSILLFSLFLFASCGKYDALEKYNRSPVVLLSQFDLFGNIVGLPSDSISDSLKLKNQFKFTFTIDDEESLILNPSCFSEHKDYTLTIDQTQVNNSGNIIFKANSPGLFKFNFFVLDSYSITGAASTQITVFDNIIPQARMAITLSNHPIPNQITVDARGSFDPDLRFGGGVVRYRFQIGTAYTVETINPVLNYVIPGSGTRDVILQVLDNCGAWSEAIYQSITL